MTFIVSTGEKLKINTSQCFYLYHHVNVLGEKKGCLQVARRFKLLPSEVHAIYCALHKKAHQMAV